jgi:hypothetical protein
MTMKNQAIVAMQLPLDINPSTQLWHTISSSRILCHNLPKYFKLAKIGSILVLGTMEDERCFSTLNFLKSAGDGDFWDFCLCMYEGHQQ